MLKLRVRKLAHNCGSSQIFGHVFEQPLWRLQSRYLSAISVERCIFQWFNPTTPQPRRVYGAAGLGLDFLRRKLWNFLQKQAGAKRDRSAKIHINIHEFKDGWPNSWQMRPTFNYRQCRSIFGSTPCIARAHASKTASNLASGR